MQTVAVGKVKNINGVWTMYYYAGGRFMNVTKLK
jgi:hypothetical protein